MFREMVYEVTGPVAEIRFTRPGKKAADTNRMLSEFSYALELAEEDEKVVGVVITGEGFGFCEGRTLQDVQRYDSQWEPFEADRRVVDLAASMPLNCLWRMPKPVIAAINGPCGGLGLAIALMCDLRFISEDAYCEPAKSGDAAAQDEICQHLSRLIGVSQALDLLFNGERITAARALALGFANRVCANDNLLDDAISYIRNLEKRASLGGLSRIKARVYGGLARNATAQQGAGRRWRMAGTSLVSSGPRL